MSKLLVIEDSEDSFRLISRAISPDADVKWTTTFFEASKLIQDNSYDLIIIDVVLPDGNGFDLLNAIQALPRHKLTATMMITSKDSTSDLVAGFSLGADDYVTKPFNTMELKARIDAKLRKTYLYKESKKKLTIGALSVNLSMHHAYLDKNGNKSKLDLTPIEFKILTFLMSKPGFVFSRDEILNQVWGEDIHVYPRSVDTHVSKLRKKMGPYSDLIESVHGTGYKILEDAQTH